MKNRRTITVKTDEENPMPIELIAESIAQVSDAFKKIKESSLTERAIVLLLNDMIPSRYGVGIKEIEAVLKYAPLLKDIYLKPKKS